MHKWGQSQRKWPDEIFWGDIEYLHLGPMTFAEFLLAVGEKALADFIAHYQIFTEIPKPIHDNFKRKENLYKGENLFPPF